MSFHIQYAPNVADEVKKLPLNMLARIRRTVEERLTDNPFALTKPLQYSFKGQWRLRVGDYRVIFRVDEMLKIVTVTHIKHRSVSYEL